MKNLFGLLTVFFLISGSSPAFADEALTFSSEVKQLLSQKSEMVRAIAASPVIIQSAKESNRINASLTRMQIAGLDIKWIKAKGVDDFVRPFLINDAAKVLIALRQAHPEFKEIFLSDARGLVVGATDKTTDYYQADEEWWIKTLDNGKGKNSYLGDVEYDESSGSEAIGVYVPVIDPQTGETVGVLKAICDLDAIKMEL